MALSESDRVSRLASRRLELLNDKSRRIDYDIAFELKMIEEELKVICAHEDAHEINKCNDANKGANNGTSNNDSRGKSIWCSPIECSVCGIRITPTSTSPTDQELYRILKRQINNNKTQESTD